MSERRTLNQLMKLSMNVSRKLLSKAQLTLGLFCLVWVGGPGVLQQAQAADSQPLTEEGLVEIHRRTSIVDKSNEARRLQQALGLAVTEEMYSPRLKAGAGRLLSNEDPTNRFQPVFSPIDEISVGAVQKLPFGVSVEGGLFGNQKSATDNSFSDATQVGAKLSLQMDLLKNRFGNLDDTKLSTAKVGAKRADIDARLASKKQELAVRKIYWSLIAKAQSLVLAGQLESSAQKQLDDANSRRRLGVADQGEIARFSSQLQSRKSSILLFEYENELLWQGLRKQMKDFDPDQFKLDINSASTKQSAVQQCLAQVLSAKKVDPAATLLDEAIKMYRVELDGEIKMASSHAAPDLTLVANSQTTGVGDSYGKASETLGDRFRTGHYVGLQFNMPLGEHSKRTQSVMLAAKKSAIEAQAELLESELQSTFSTMEKSLKLLVRGLNSQVANSDNLKVSYKETVKKFDQGRIPLLLVVNEQDALFQSELQEINLKTQIAHALLDYFSVFTEFPCAWNNLIQPKTSN